MLSCSCSPVKLCSLDTRNREQNRRPLSFCQPAVGEEEGGRRRKAAVMLLCSRNARPSLDSARGPKPVEGRKALVGRAR